MSKTFKYQILYNYYMSKSNVLTVSPHRDDEQFVVNFADLIDCYKHVYVNTFPTFNMGPHERPGEIRTTTNHVTVFRRVDEIVTEFHVSGKIIRMYNEKIGDYDVLVRINNDSGWKYNADRLLFNETGTLFPCRRAALNPWELAKPVEETTNMKMDFVDKNEQKRELI